MHPGKIPRLPQTLRDELNRRLADNESSATLLPWLNALPAVRAVLAAEFDSRPISKQNLCKWRAHGFAAWQLRREMLAQSRPPATPEPTPSVSSVPFVPSVPSVPSAAPSPQWSEHLAHLLTMHYFAAMSRWDGRSDALCRPRFRALRALCREVHQLRHADHARQRLQLQCQLLASQTAKASCPTSSHPSSFILPPFIPIPTEKSAQTPAKPHIVKPRQAQKIFSDPAPMGPHEEGSTNPKGIPAQSPRLPLSGYLGSTGNQQFQPQRGCGQRRSWPEGKGRNRVAVDNFVWTRTQGRLADSPTPGFETQSLWDCQNGRASSLRGASWSVAVSRAARDQPQRFGPSSRVEYFRHAHSCEAAAAGLRHSRGPGPGPATERGGKRGARPLSCGRRSSKTRGSRSRAKAPSPLRFAGAVHDACGFAGALWQEKTLRGQRLCGKLTA